MSAAQVRRLIGSKAGATLSRKQIRADVRALWRLGQFRDVSIWLRPAGGDQVAVVFELREAPLIARVIVRGHAPLGRAGARAVLALWPGQVASLARVNRRARKLQREYRNAGYYRAAVNAYVRASKSPRAAVVVVVSAGKLGLIRSVRFRGNRHVSTRALAATMDTRSGRVNTPGGILRRDIIATDIKRMTSVYYDRGFMNVDIGPPKIRIHQRRGTIHVDIPISEGPRFRLGAVRVTGAAATSNAVHRRLLRSRRGAVFNRSRIAADIDRLERYYRRRWGRAKVDPQTRIDLKRRTIELDLVVVKTP